MNEDLYTIYLENGQSIVLLSEKRCICSALDIIDRFNKQLEFITKSFKEPILKDLNDIHKSQFIVRLFYSNIPGRLEYSLVDINSLDLDKYSKNGKVYVSDCIDGSYYSSIKYKDKQYCLFV